MLAITGRIPAPCRAYSGDTERVLEDALGARAHEDKDLRSQLLQPFRAEFPDGFHLLIYNFQRRVCRPEQR